MLLDNMTKIQCYTHVIFNRINFFTKMLVVVQYKAPGYSEIRTVVSNLYLRMYSSISPLFFPYSKTQQKRLRIDSVKAISGSLSQIQL